MKINFNKMCWFNDGMFMMAILISIAIIKNLGTVGIKLLIISTIGILIHPTIFLIDKIKGRSSH